MAAQKLGNVAIKTVVKLNLNKTPTNFVVAQQGKPTSGDYDDSCNGTWLVIQNIYNNQEWNSHDNNLYADSTINSWLNSSFVALLDDDIQGVIKTVKIPYCSKSGRSPTISSGANGLSVKAFLLSIKETGAKFDDYASQEGAVLTYFKDGGDAGRIANYNGSPTYWWTRSAFSAYHNASACRIDSDGTPGASNTSDNFHGIRPVIILPSDLYVNDEGFVVINTPPTAPGSIDVTGVVSGGSATITLTAATDPDGTVESYIYERQVDGGAWEQVAQANSLTQTDTIGEEWGTVAYRACAVDNGGVSGPYVTSSTETVNDGWTIISGPAESMGSKAVPFDFAFSVSVSGQSSTGAITVSAALDGKQVYSGTPNAGEQVTIPIKTHLLGAGTHTVEVQASKDDYLPASKRYTFTVPAVTIPDGGVGALAQGPDGRAVYHTTLAQRCIGRDGVDIQAQMDALAARVKTLEG